MGSNTSNKSPMDYHLGHRFTFTRTDTNTSRINQVNPPDPNHGHLVMETELLEAASNDIAVPEGSGRRRSNAGLPGPKNEKDVKHGEEKQRSSWKRVWLRILWDTLGKSPEERAFLHKADIWILTYVSVAYFIKYLNQTNINNAYVSGMKEDFSMFGNEYNLLQTLFTSGYCIGNTPSQLLMTRIRPSIWLPSLELIWGILVICMAATQSLTVFYIIRFFVGILEASAYPGILTLLGNWYTPSELGKRAAIFFTSACLSQMFSGYLQASLYVGMDGRLGLPAWRWLFIFDGILTIPVALFGFLALPDSPSNSRARWLTPSDKQLAIKRMAAVGRAPPGKLARETFQLIFTDWPVYVFTIVFIGQLLGNRIYAYFGIYLKSTGRYTVAQTNIIPSAGFGFQAVMALLMAWISDLTQSRELIIVFGALVSIIGGITLIVWPEDNIHVMLMGWILTFGQGGNSALMMSYINELLSFSAEQRLIVIGVVETTAFVCNAWVILLVYPADKAPRFPYGYQAATAFFALSACGILVVRYLVGKLPPDRRYRRRMLAQSGTNEREGEQHIS